MLAHTPDPLAGASGDCHAEDQCGRADRNLVNRTFMLPFGKDAILTETGTVMILLMMMVMRRAMVVV